jgi:hypothetical protein
MTTKKRPRTNAPVLQPVEQFNAADRLLLDAIVAEAGSAFRSFEQEPEVAWISVFGSARCHPGSPLYEMTYRVTEKVISEMRRQGYQKPGVITGGGPCVMEAGLKAGSVHGAQAAGLNIQLPNEPKASDFQTISLSFSKFMGVRKLIFIKYSLAFINMPGGYGTLDELFEVLTLIQTGLIERRKVYLVDREFWSPLDRYIRETLVERGMISACDPELYEIVDPDEPFEKQLVESILSTRPPSATRLS